MYRIAIENLYKWKASKRRKPMVIEGARQVGKTWLMKEFGSKAYADTVYINFDSNSVMADLFASDLDTNRLIMGLEPVSYTHLSPLHSHIFISGVLHEPKKCGYDQRGWIHLYVRHERTNFNALWDHYRISSVSCGTPCSRHSR